MAFSFKLEAVDSQTAARAGRITTDHGDVLTPAFMPVGTAGSVKTLTPDELTGAGADILLANTYHLSLRPGVDTVRRMGGLHRLMGWPGAILTDSGGFQVMSLSPLRKVTDEGVEFRSHLDGRRRMLTPEEAMERLAEADATKARLVELRFFTGLTLAEAAQVLGVSEPTAKRYWAYARAWLFQEIERLAEQ